jgi:SAM-dependent methyltransferase
MLSQEKSCRSCGGPVSVTLANLGLQPPSNNYLASAADIAWERRYPLRAAVCGNCKLVQLDYDVSPNELFQDYSYFSSYADSWLKHAQRYCEMAQQRFALDSSSLVIELASNDGYLLKNFAAANIPVLGIDPSETVAAAAKKIGVPTLVEFFGLEVAARLASEGKCADLIIGNNVLAHVPNINDFVAGMANLLKPTGTISLEFPHLLRLIEKNEFDTIYHEHFSYISLLAIRKLFERHELKIYDVQELPTHGGSLRIFASHREYSAIAGHGGLQKVCADEAAAGLDQLSTYTKFSEQVEACRRSLLEFFARSKAEHKLVVGYGAAAKGNTLLNYCGATAMDLSCVADRSPHKQQKLLPGTHIPIVTPEEMLAQHPDYVLILPWNLKEEIMGQLGTIRAWGGRFVTAVPVTQIYE